MSKMEIAADPDQSAEIARLKAELSAMTIERNISIQNEKDTQHLLEVVEEKLALEKRNYSSLHEMYVAKTNAFESINSIYKTAWTKLSNLKTALNEVLE